MTDEYVTPPKREDEEYVAPPKKNTAAAQTFNSQEDDYVAPPQSSNAAAASKNLAAKKTEQPKKMQPATVAAAPKSQNKKAKPQPNKPIEKKRGYFDTPKQSWRFYMTGYLVVSLLLYYEMVWSSIRTGWPVKLFWLVYIVGSNYTFSWLSDYFRFKGGVLGWFFTPYGSVKSGMAYASMKSYQTGNVKKTWGGQYKIQTQNSTSRSLFSIIVVTVIVEVLKYIVCAPVACLSLFFHKKTMENYFAAVNAPKDVQ